LKISVGLWFILSLSLLYAQDTGDRLRLIHADLLRREVVDGQVLQRLEGNVKFQQGDTIIECDVAEQLLGDEKTALIGRVRIYDQEQTLSADTVYFFQKRRAQVAAGHVVNITAKDTTFADRMVYYEKDNRLVSTGDVRIIDIEDRSVLTGQHAEYFRSTQYGKITGEPMMVQRDSLARETTRITADTMEVYRARKYTHIDGDVRIVQPEMTATCGKADFFRAEDKIVLIESPEILQKDRAIKGDSLTLFLQDAALQRAVVVGHAEATSDADTSAAGRWVNRLTGQKMTFFFEEKKLKHIIVEDQATSLYHIIEKNEYKGANEISGDRIAIFLEDGKASRVVVSSSPDKSAGTFRPPKR